MFKLPRLTQWIGFMVLLFLIILTIFRLVFFLHYKPLDYPLPGSAFIMGLRLDLRITAFIAMLMILLTTIPLMNPFRRKAAVRIWQWLLSIIFLIILGFYIIDFFHYDYLKQRLNASVLNYLQDAGISMGMVWETYPVIPGLLAMLVAVLLFFMMSRFLLKRLRKKEVAPVKRPWIFNLVFFMLMILSSWGTLGQFPLRWSDVFSLKDAFRAQLALNPMQMFFSTLSFKQSTYDEEATRSYYSLMADYLGIKDRDSINLNYLRTENPEGLVPGGSDPNIVLVICESFSVYKSSMSANPLQASPYFDSLSKKGIYFDHCFTPTYGTARGVWATLTGIPDVHAPGTSSRNPSLVDQHTILNDFSRHEKLYFIGGSASWANIRGLLEFNIQGLKLFEQEDFEAEKVDVWGVSDKELFLETNKILSKQKAPFFAIIQTADNHRPYTIPSRDLAEFRKIYYSQDSLKRFGFESNDELNAFRYMDFSIKKFMEAASREAYFQNTVFVFIGDHGIRGNAGDIFPKAWTEQALTTVHVPFLFYSPLLQPGLRHNICSQVDVLPSIAGLISQPYTNTTLGRDLFDRKLLADPLRSSSSFIIEPDDNLMGMMAGDHYFRKNMQNGNTEVVSIRNNNSVTGKERDSVMTKLDVLTNAYYHTSKYMLFHNRKK
jgi:phosphoglycerol transferase MdoB-like AlkP superfamily enzyme